MSCVDVWWTIRRRRSSVHMDSPACIELCCCWNCPSSHTLSHTLSSHTSTTTNTHRFGPKPVVARTPGDILAARGVKPTLSPNLDVLATVEALAGTVKRLLFIGVGCQVCGWGGFA